MSDRITLWIDPAQPSDALFPRFATCAEADQFMQARSMSFGHRRLPVTLYVAPGVYADADDFSLCFQGLDLQVIGGGQAPPRTPMAAVTELALLAPVPEQPRRPGPRDMPIQFEGFQVYKPPPKRGPTPSAYSWPAAGGRHE